MFWLALAAIPLAVGGILVGVQLSQAASKVQVWSNGWFLGGGVLVLVALAMALWALALFIAHRHVDAHQPGGRLSRFERVNWSGEIA